MKSLYGECTSLVNSSEPGHLGTLMLSFGLHMIELA